MDRTLFLRLAFAAMALVIFLGCASVPPPPRRIPRHIPFPKATPFDESPTVRAEYLDGYRRGYLQAYGGGGSVGRIYKDGYIRTPAQLGWEEGNYDGIFDSVIKPMLDASSSAGTQ